MFVEYYYDKRMIIFVARYARFSALRLRTLC